jgi:hypothetical protein
MLVRRVYDKSAVVDRKADIKRRTSIASRHKHRPQEDCEMCCVPILDRAMQYKSVIVSVLCKIVEIDA